MRRVTGMLDLGDCLSLDTANLAHVVYLPPVQIPTPLKDGQFMFAGMGVRLANNFGSACSKHKCSGSLYNFCLMNFFCRFFFINILSYLLMELMR